ncbi:hypothetical protein V2W30_11590 [Streptomyces sp. Q6]|uniref:Uncharacterized protein n=1 Tax=Streptomyces citrinus TaxID=3118173 RepID=A0ACD5A9P8_9ACTN
MTTPPAKGGTRRGRLLLFVALLFGIVGMHTLGHPTGHTAPMSPAMDRASVSTTMDKASVNTTMDMTSVSTSFVSPASVTTSSVTTSMSHTSMSAPTDTGAAHGHEGPGDGGMDPLSVCLAVLGSFTLLLLTAAVLRPLTAAGVLRAAPRGMTYARRPHPPRPELCCPVCRFCESRPAHRPLRAARASGR